MYLYHYSDILFDQLKTRKAQGIKIPKKKRDEMIAWKLASNDVGIYDEHISLFFDSIPRDLPQIFELRHPFWVPGKTLYEYVVESQALEKNIGFKVSESPEGFNFLIQYKELMQSDVSKILLDQMDDYGHIPDLISRYSESKKLSLDEDQILLTFVTQRNKLLREKGLMGDSRTLLEQAILRFRNKTRGYYLRAYEMFKDDEPNMVKYAAGVPHVGIYPSLGIVKPKHINKITLDGEMTLARESLLDRW